MTENQEGYDNTPAGLPTPPPIIPGADMELADWLTATHTQLTVPQDDPSPAAAADTTAAPGQADEPTMLDWLADRGITDTAADTQADGADDGEGRDEQPDGVPSSDTAGPAPEDTPFRPAAQTTTDRIIAAGSAGGLAAQAAAAAAFGAQATNLGTEPAIDLDAWGEPAAPATDHPTHDDKDRHVVDDEESDDSELDFDAIFDQVMEKRHGPGWDAPDESADEVSDDTELDFDAIFDQVMEKRHGKDSQPRSRFGTGPGYGHRANDHGLDTGRDDGYGI